MPTFTSDGVTLFFRDQGRGPPVLLLHAFPLSSDLFEPQLAALSSRHRVITLDLRGFGRSSGAPGPTEMSTLARDAVALLDHLDIPSAVIGGVSMGGYVTMALMAEHPQRARAVILMDTQMGADDEAGRAKREETAQAVEARGMDVLVESMMPRLVAETAAPAVKIKVEAMIRANKPAGSASALRGLALRPDRREVLARFTAPALVVVGEADVITPVAKAEEMVGVLPNARLVRIPRAGHLANIEARDEVNSALQTFLSGVT